MIANDGVNVYTVEKTAKKIRKNNRRKINESSPDAMIGDDKNLKQEVIRLLNDLVGSKFKNLDTVVDGIEYDKNEDFVYDDSASILALAKDANMDAGDLADYLADGIQNYHDSNESYKFSVNNNPVVGKTQKIVESLQKNNTTEEITELISLLLSNFDLVNFMDSVTTFDPEYSDDTVDMMQGDNVVFVVVDDAAGMMGGEVATGETEDVAADIMNDFGIDITAGLDDEEDINEEEDADAIEREGELMELENELEIVEANIKKIEDLDETFKEDDEIVQLESELQTEKETLIKRIAELSNEEAAQEEGGEEGSTEEVIKNIIDQLSKLLTPETAETETEEDPEAVVECKPVTLGKVVLTPFVNYSKKGNEISFECFVGIEGFTDKMKQKISESKLNIVPESNIVIAIDGDLKETIAKMVTKLYEFKSNEGHYDIGDITVDDADLSELLALMQKGTSGEFGDGFNAEINGDKITITSDDGDVASTTKKEVNQLAGVNEEELDDEGNPIVKPELDDEGNPITKPVKENMDAAAVSLGFDKDKIAELNKWASENGDDEVDPAAWLEKAKELFGERADELAELFGLD
jgi:hypothetical protein